LLPKESEGLKFSPRNQDFSTYHNQEKLCLLPKHVHGRQMPSSQELRGKEMHLMN